MFLQELEFLPVFLDFLNLHVEELLEGFLLEQFSVALDFVLLGEIELSDAEQELADVVIGDGFEPLEFK